MSHQRPLRGAARALTAAILLILVAGCSEPVVQPGAVRWSPPASPGPGDVRWSGNLAEDGSTGALTAPGFNELIDTADPGWAKSPETAAAELLDLDRPFDGPIEIYLHQETKRDEAVVTVTLTRLGDDSIQAMRYRVVFARGDDGRYRFVSVVYTTRCHSGRGHRSFKTGPCS